MSMTPEQIGALDATQLPKLTTSQVAALTATQAAAIATDVISAMEVADVAALSTSALRALTTDQIQQMTTSQIAAITTDQITALTIGQLHDLTAPQAAALTAPQLTAMTAPQISELMTTFSVTPLILDLNGDGVHTVGIGQGVEFDLTGSGVQHAVGWVSASDGFLVLDRNGDGVINSGRELFGQGTLLADGSTAKTGYEALGALDTNQDGVIDINDAEFAKLQVWQDVNQDGVTQSGGSRYESGRNIPKPLAILLWLHQSGKVSDKDLADAQK